MLAQYTTSSNRTSLVVRDKKITGVCSPFKTFGTLYE